MGDEGFAAEAPQKSVGPGLSLVAGPFSPVVFLLTSDFQRSHLQQRVHSSLVPAPTFPCYYHCTISSDMEFEGQGLEHETREHIAYTDEYWSVRLISESEG